MLGIDLQWLPILLSAVKDISLVTTSFSGGN